MVRIAFGSGVCLLLSSLVSGFAPGGLVPSSKSSPHHNVSPLQPTTTYRSCRLNDRQPRQLSTSLAAGKNGSNKQNEVATIMATLLLGISTSLAPLPSDAAPSTTVTTAPPPPAKVATPKAMAPAKPTDPVEIAKASLTTASNQEADIKKVVKASQSAADGAKKELEKATKANDKALKTLTDLQKAKETSPDKICKLPTCFLRS